MYLWTKIRNFWPYRFVLLRYFDTNRHAPGMDTEKQCHGDDARVENESADDQHISTSEEPVKSNGSTNSHAITADDDTAAPKGRNPRTSSALAVFNRRIRLFFRPWKWRRRARAKRSIAEQPHGGELKMRI